MSTQVEQEIPREVRLSAAQDKIRQAYPEKAEFIVRQLDAIIDALPQTEREAFLDDPTGFISHDRLFRGMTAEKVAETLRDEAMKPQAGQYGSRAVFETDSPFQALTFESGSMPALAVIDRSMVVLNGKLLTVGSPEYKQAMEEKLEHPPEGMTHQQYLYEVQNEVDTETRAVPQRNWHNIELRQTQPLSTVRCFIIDQPGQPPLVLYPDVPADRETLKHLYTEELAAAA